MFYACCRIIRGLESVRVNKKFGGKQQAILSLKIVNQYEYISHHSQILEVGGEQVIFFTESYIGPLNMTSEKRVMTKDDTTVSIDSITKR